MYMVHVHVPTTCTAVHVLLPVVGTVRRGPSRNLPFVNMGCELGPEKLCACAWGSRSLS